MADNAVKIPFTEAAAPATPATGKVVTYAKTDGLMYSKDDAGVETLMSGGGSGAVATDAIWDVAGDLAVGTGANTAARKALGTALQVLRVNAGATDVEWAASSGVASGTANPGTPTSGDLFFRTDLDFLITYDGTRWVTVQEYAIAGLPRVLVDGITVTTVNAVRYSVPTDYDIFVTLLDISTFVATTNNGSNYWQADINKIDTANAVTSIGNVTTAAEANNVWTRHKVTVNATLAGATYPSLSTSLTKTASPGGLFIGSATLRYRLIVT